MTAEEIRNKLVPGELKRGEGIEYKDTYFLREIAAQLAELNENLRTREAEGT